MSDSIKIDDLDKAIAETLRQHLKEIQGKVIAKTNTIGRKTLKKIVEKSPVDTGQYSEGWRMRKVDKRDKAFGSYKIVIHNETDYRLIHLLEFGHANKNGTGRTKPIPHIAPAEQEAAKEYYEEIQKVLSED